MLISASNVIHQKSPARVGIASDIFIIYQKDPRVEVFFMLVLACRKLVEFDDKTILWEGNAGTNVNGINHTDVELVAVVWLDI